jgi:hypothetical protein
VKQMQLNGFVLRKDRYSTREVAEIFKVSTVTVRNWVAAGQLKGDQLAPRVKNAKRDKWRWVIFSDGLHDLEVNKQALIQASMKYWPKLMQQIEKKVKLSRSRKGLEAVRPMIVHTLQGEAS